MKTTITSLLFLLFFAPIYMYGQTAVKGTVTEQSSSIPLPGVNVVIKNSTTGTATDFDGNYQINAKKGDVIVFSYIGYQSQEITFTGQASLNVQLKENAAQLNEVVVIGYGTTTKKDATGSVESITAKEFTKGNIVTPENLLSGRVAGVSINTSGSPGSGSEIRIRGGSSINASNNPLIIIDGLPIDNNGVNGSNGILATINPNDIDSFSVLKDASATAIYGSRASNGVIIIVTKKGKATFSATYDAQYSFGKLTDRIDVFSGDEFRQLIASQPVNGTTLNESLLGTASTDWQNEIFRNTVSSQHSVSLQGSLFKALPARFSFGTTNQEGALITSEFERRNLGLALNPSMLDNHLKINLNANLAFEDNRFADTGQIGSAIQYDPSQPVYDPTSPFDGYYQHRNGTLVSNGTTNPVASLLQRNNYGDANRTYGNLNIDYKLHFLPELRAVLNAGYDETESKSIDYTSTLVPTNDPVIKGNSSIGFQKRTNKSLDGYLNYAKTFGNVRTELMTGYSYQKFTNNGGSSGNRRDPASFSSTFADPDVVLIGFFGRANFTLSDKYLLTLTYRRDGTSRFSEDNRWGNFPAAAFAWNLSDEDFLKESKTISNLKLRVGYGITGQQDISGNNDIFLNRYRGGDENSKYQFGNTVIESLIASEINPDLKWEETSTIEFGLDYGLFNNSISGSLNFFQKNSTDLLFTASVADGTNFSNSIIQNIGELQIQGIEFSLNTDVIKKEDINVNFNFNATFLNREMKQLALGQDVRTGGFSSGGTGNTIQLLREGEAPNSFSVFKQLYDTSGNPIEGAYADLNGDNVINDDDRYLKENPNADIILGFQSSINYKNLDLSFNLRANIGNYAYNSVTSSKSQYERLLDNSVLANLPTSVLNTKFQRTSDVIISDIYLEDASFLKMDNITLGYTFNNISKTLKSIRLWGGVQNVFTITNYSGLDPEVFGGIDSVIYPRPRTILTGANFKF